MNNMIDAPSGVLQPIRSRRLLMDLTMMTEPRYIINNDNGNYVRILLTIPQ